MWFLSRKKKSPAELAAEAPLAVRREIEGFLDGLAELAAAFRMQGSGKEEACAAAIRAAPPDMGVKVKAMLPLVVDYVYSLPSNSTELAALAQKGLQKMG